MCSAASNRTDSSCRHRQEGFFFLYHGPWRKVAAGTGSVTQQCGQRSWSFCLPTLPFLPRSLLSSRLPPHGHKLATTVPGITFMFNGDNKRGRGAVPVTTISSIRKAKLFLESPQQISTHGLPPAVPPSAWQRVPGFS